MYLKIGSRGEDVKRLQKVLNLYPDGVFGPLTDEAVRLYQKEHNLAVDGIVGDRTWSMMFQSTNRRGIKEIIIHCSATKEGRDYTVEDIRRWHLDRGFSDIGYHYVIYRDGSVHQGRSESLAGAHCTGHNSISIGVCYVGGLDENGKPKDTRTPAQKKSMTELIKDLRRKYPDAKIYPHSKFANKACPCFDVESEFS